MFVGRRSLACGVYHVEHAGRLSGDSVGAGSRLENGFSVMTIDVSNDVARNVSHLQEIVSLIPVWAAFRLAILFEFGH